MTEGGDVKRRKKLILPKLHVQISGNPLPVSPQQICHLRPLKRRKEKFIFVSKSEFTFKV
jgi:hypothetical protein